MEFSARGSVRRLDDSILQAIGRWTDPPSVAPTVMASAPSPRAIAETRYGGREPVTDDGAMTEVSFPDDDTPSPLTSDAPPPADVNRDAISDAPPGDKNWTPPPDEP